MNTNNAFQTDNVDVFQDIFEQYVTDGAFLWLLRSNAVKQPHYSVAELAELEQRIDNNLNALMTSLDKAWDVCLEALELEQAGEVFVASVTAFRSRDIDKIKIAVDAGLTSQENLKGLVSALAWLPGKLVHSWVQKFLNSKDLDHKYLAIAVCSARREDPGDILPSILQREDCLAHIDLHASTLRLIGELKLANLHWALKNASTSDEPEICFWASWSSVLIGDNNAVTQLYDFVCTPGELQSRAIQIAFRVLSVEQGRHWISTLAGNPEHSRAVIEAIAVLGDPHAVPWLIDKMRNMDVARFAAEAFTTITGIELERYHLSVEASDEIEVLPDDNPDNEDVSMDDDEHLPYPDVDKIAYTWKKYGSRYNAGQRYFLGKIITGPALELVLMNGLQRQRAAAALELALLNRAVPCFNVKAVSSGINRQG